MTLGFLRTSVHAPVHAERLAVASAVTLCKSLPFAWPLEPQVVERRAGHGMDLTLPRSVNAELCGGIANQSSDGHGASLTRVGSFSAQRTPDYAGGAHEEGSQAGAARFPVFSCRGGRCGPAV